MLQVEYLLEFAHGFLCFRRKNAIRLLDFWNCRVVISNAVELALNRADILSRTAQAKRNAGIGGNVGRDGGIGDDIDIISIVVLQDFIWSIALFGQLYRAPLGKAGALPCSTAAILGKIWSNAALLDDIAIKNLIHDLGDIFKDISILYKCLVVGDGICNIEIISLAWVPFCIDPIERIGDLRQNIGPKSSFRPGGVNFAGRYVFHIVCKILNIVSEGQSDIGGV